MSWVFVVVGLALLGGVAVAYFATAGGDEAGRGPAAGGAAVEPEIAAEGGVTGADAPRDPEPAEEGEPVSSPAEVVRQISSGLDRARLWSTVEASQGALVIRSGECAAPALREVLAANRAGLVAAEIDVVRCLERHGAQVFELPVAELGP